MWDTIKYVFPNLWRESDEHQQLALVGRHVSVQKRQLQSVRREFHWPGMDRDSGTLH